MVSASTKNILHSAIRALIRPLARFCVSRSVSIQEFIELSKGAFIDIAVEELKKSAGVVNSSRISVLTGLRRAEISRLYLNQDYKTDDQIHMIGRVIGQWEQDAEFCSKSGVPRVLSCDGDTCEFFQLVRKVTTHVGPAGILAEMIRTKAAERTSRGVKLLRSGAVYDMDMLQGFEIAARDIGTLLKTVDINLRKTDEIGHPHTRTYYDNIYLAELPQIKRWLLAQTKAFHKQIRDYLADFDKDLCPDSKRTDEAAGGKVSLSSFALSENPLEDF